MSSEAFAEYIDYSSLGNVAIALHDTIRYVKMLYNLFILGWHLHIWARLALMPHPQPLCQRNSSLKSRKPITYCPKSCQLSSLALTLCAIPWEGFAQG